ncbi:alpha/beta hydrolase fold domain-containing protein [Janibacter sp. G56]|uniref:alpha/beta hydrolase fold domain-containing protein n=1 Tax=Janibacter sp. G56 TaxID=3418717 RepID=UPI003D05D808
MLKRRRRDQSAPTTVSAAAQALIRDNAPTPFPRRRFRGVVRRSRAQALIDRAPRIAALTEALTRDVTTERVAGLEVVSILPRSAPEHLRTVADAVDADHVVYLHGGAYVVGVAHDALSMSLADATGLPVRSIAYPLAPETPHPGPVEATLVTYRALLECHGGRVVLAGISAGGGLALALLQRLRQEGSPLPAALVLLTPWVDLTPSGDSDEGNEGRDPSLQWRRSCDRAARAYAAGAPFADPLLSPVHGDYGPDVPPTLITTGTRDLYLSGCVRLYWRLREAGAPVDLRVWEGMWHAFYGEAIPEARHAHAEIAAWVHDRLA